MKKIGALALVLAFSGCASMRQPQVVVCESRQSYQQGLADGEKGLPLNQHFSAQCTPESEAIARKKYREGFAEGKKKRKPAETQATDARPKGARVLQSLPTKAWVCEVEASAKIFTGVGVSLEAALRSAQESCGAHFRASACQQSECKQSF